MVHVVGPEVFSQTFDGSLPGFYGNNFRKSLCEKTCQASGSGKKLQASSPLTGSCFGNNVSEEVKCLFTVDLEKSTCIQIERKGSQGFTEKRSTLQSKSLLSPDKIALEWIDIDHRVVDRGNLSLDLFKKVANFTECGTWRFFAKNQREKAIAAKESFSKYKMSNITPVAYFIVRGQG